MFQVSVLWGLPEWKAGASPGASNTFTGKQVGRWCSGAAAAAFPCPWHQIHSCRLGESQLWALNTEAALPKQKHTLSEDQCNQKTRRVSKSWDGEGRGGTRRTELIYWFSPCPPPAQQRLRKSLRAAHAGCAPCGQTSLLSQHPVRSSFVPWTFNPDSPVVEYFITANRRASVPKILLFVYILHNSEH